MSVNLPPLEEHAIDYAVRLWQNAFTAASYADELGNIAAVQVTSDYPDKAITNPTIQVGMVGGTVDQPIGMGQGLVGYDTDNGNWVHQLYAAGATLVFTSYATHDAGRRYISAFLRWVALVGYVILPNGIRQDAWILEQLRGHGIIPGRRLFEQTQFPDPDYAESRPYGLPFKAIDRLPVDLSILWTTPGYAVSGITLGISQVTPSGITLADAAIAL